METLDETFSQKKPKKQVIILLKAMKREKQKYQEDEIKL